MEKDTKTKTYQSIKRQHKYLVSNVLVLSVLAFFCDDSLLLTAILSFFRLRIDVFSKFTMLETTQSQLVTPFLLRKLRQ